MDIGDAIEQEADQRMAAIDAAILKSIVGSRITSLELVKDKRTRHMWMLTIKTTAKPVQVASRAFVTPDTITLRVRL